MGYKSVSSDKHDSGAAPRGAHQFPRDHQGQGSFSPFHYSYLIRGEASTLKRQGASETHTDTHTGEVGTYCYRYRWTSSNVHGQFVCFF